MPKFCGLFGTAAPKYQDSNVPSAEIPRDPLRESFHDISNMESFLTLIESYGQELSNALSTLKHIPEPLMVGFEKHCSKGFDGQDDIWDQFSELVSVCAYRVTHAISHIEKLSQLVEQVRPRFTEIEEAATKRREAWAVQVQQDRETEKVKRKAISLEKKSAQMNASMQASENFQGCTSNLEQIINEVLSQQSSIAGIALTTFNDCLTDIFRVDATPDMRSTNDNESKDFVLQSIAGSMKSAQSSLPPALSTVNNNRNNNNIRYSTTDRVPPLSTEQSLPPPDPSIVNKNSINQRLPSSTCATMKYVVGEKVEIWSSSKNKWVEGTVMQVFEKEGIHDNFRVPAGVVKVESDAGVKFVQPDQVDSILRKMHP